MESSPYNSQPLGKDNIESIKVLVRVRPLSQSELADHNESVVDIIDNQSLKVTSADGKKSFSCSYDSVLGPNSTQVEVYDVVRSCTQSVIDGFNSTIFAYGQTGSGKTHSMYGPPNYAGVNGGKAAPRNNDLMGLIPRAVDEIFEIVHNRAITEFQVHCSFVQIYNENLYDMLRDASMNTPLSIREDNKEIYVQGLSEYNVKSVADTLQLLKIAEENRAIRETNMNMFSSRSHSIFQIQLEHKRVADDGGEITYKAKFNLVDLAGSEKWNTKLQMRDEHIAEMTNINLSLHTLGKCISALAQASVKQNRESESRAQTRERDRDSREWSLDTRSLGSLDHSGSTIGSIKDFPTGKSGRNLNVSSNTPKEPAPHIPFRESKLTRLLQDSLGGNAKTFLIATVSPARSNSEESISTLKFADRAKQVMVQAVINETRPVDYAMVKRLQQEIEMLKSLLKRVVQSQTTGGGAQGNAQFNAMLKQANTAADLQDLLGAAPGSNVNAGNGANSGGSSRSGSNSPQMFRPAPFYGADGGDGQSNVPPGGGLEYVISLEKALNQEQIHSQHLAKKNETLIKELEELKFQNLQLQSSQGGHFGGATAMGHSPGPYNPPPLAKAISVNSLAITAPQVTQVITSVQSLLKENAKLYEQNDQVQKTMKKFFKFQIEEEDLKLKLETVFATLKDLKSASASSTVVDNFAFLEFLATNVSKGGSTGSVLSPSAKGPAPIEINKTMSSNIAPAGASALSTEQSINNIGAAIANRKQMRRTNEPAGGQLPAMPAHLQGPPPQQSQQSQQGQQVHKDKGAGRYQQQDVPHPQTLPTLGMQSNINSSSHHTSGGAENRYSNYSSEPDDAPYGRNTHSGGSDHGYSGGAEEYTQNHDYHQSSNAYQQQQYQHQPASSYGPSGIYSASAPLHSNLNNFNHHSHSQSQSQGVHQPHASQGLPSAAPTLSYRVRGGPQHGAAASGAPSVGASTSSLHSSGGWIVPAEEDAAAAEEALKLELKKAKKKLRKQQKMQEWQRIKEEKQRAEQEAEAAQRAAEEEAELLKEQKRKDNAEKAKKKLASYHNKVKTEAEKIQELKNLGIDPSSLF